MKQLYYLLISGFLLLSFSKLQAQCNIIADIETCDMETIDYDSDGTPDGVINLYDETGLIPEPGEVWESSGSENATIALDPTSGELRLWKLVNASDKYQFKLISPSCGTDPRAVVNFILGPYAGKPATVGFFSVCDINDDCTPGIEIDIDLFEALEAREQEAPPHLNGEWFYTGSLPSSEYLLDGHEFGGTIPYSPEDGSPIDSQDYTFEYVVSQEGSCITDRVDVRITLVRPSFAGYASEYNICYEDIDAWDRIIDLSNDEYLKDEDLSGVWKDQDNNLISNQINLKDYVDDFYNSPEYYPGFDCHKFSFSYTVESRTAICNDDTSRVTFTIFEELKQFQQENPIDIVCPASNPLSELSLYSLIDFQPGFSYRNPNDEDELVFWSFEDGPANGDDLGLGQFLIDTEISERHIGTINLRDAVPGRYRYKFTVYPDIFCADYSDQFLYENDVCRPLRIVGNPCKSISTIVTVDILDFDYAGEDTELEFCETDNNGSVSLRSFLQTDGKNIDVGIWTETGTTNVINDSFIFPETVDNTSLYSFTHTTDNGNGCIDSAVLEFSIYPEANAGIDGSVQLCTNDLTVTLFDQLGGTPDTTGIWNGPFGYESTNHLGVFDTADVMLPILGPGTYIYTVPGNDGCPDIDQASVTISIVEPIAIGNDRSDTFCKLDGSVNLYSLLDRDTPRIGVFTDTDNTKALSAEGVLDFETLTNQIYNFEYSIPNTAPCDNSTLMVSVQIVDLPIPVVPKQEFCILDAKRLDDVEVDVLNYNWYETQDSDTPIVDNPLLYDNQIYYIANVDTDNCESERLAVSINILNTGERFSNGELCTLEFQDGVSPNGDIQNDSFALFIEEVYNIPIAFPDFDLQIFNRYGSLVFEGNRNTEEFRGESNVSIRLGDDLPSGTYFYIFNPNFDNNLPIQGSFYLSR
ncbi:gliding motility-associated C-terminal domain-containing protein [Aquimarina sp. 2-A2]|uniref:gliding motility-associated C-terminal domain-containing protein n=1 Tax=Aquimarina sp. 2-A2 TaxID=3382644 RepID=UPI00387F2D9C